MPRPVTATPTGTAVVRAGMLAAALALSLTGCGGSDDDSRPSASGLPASTATAVPELADAVTNGISEIDAAAALKQAETALTTADGYRVAGSPTAGAPLNLLFSAGRPVSPGGSEVVGRGARGTLTQDGSTFEVRAVDSAVYVRGDLDWLADEVAESARRTLGEKWLLLPESAALSLATITDPAAFAAAVLTPKGSVQSVGVSSIEGVPALGIHDLDNDATIWLAGVGEPYPLLVERLGATSTDGALRLSDFDSDVTLTAPDADRVVVAPALSRESAQE